MVAYMVGRVATGARKEVVATRELILAIDEEDNGEEAHPTDIRTEPWWRRLGRAACQGRGLCACARRKKGKI